MIFAFTQDEKPLEDFQQRNDGWDFIFCIEYRLGAKSGSKKTSLEATAVIQARDDGGWDQSGTQ